MKHEKIIKSLILTSLFMGFSASAVTPQEASDVVDKFIAQNRYNNVHRQDINQTLDIKTQYHFLHTMQGEATATRHEKASGEVSYEGYQITSGSPLVMNKTYDEFSKGDESLNAVKMHALSSGHDLPGALTRDTYNFEFVGEASYANGTVLKFHVTPKQNVSENPALLVDEVISIDSIKFQDVHDEGHKINLPDHVKSMNFETNYNIVNGRSVISTLNSSDDLELGSAKTEFVYTLLND